MSSFADSNEDVNIRIKLPNMAKVIGAVVVDTERCKGCNLCVVSCPCDVLELVGQDVNKKGYHYVQIKNPESCIGCANCGYVCPDACLTVYRKKVE